MFDQGRGLEVAVAVAVGAADAFSVDGDGAADLEPRHGEALQHRLDLLGIDGRDDAVQG